MILQSERRLSHQLPFRVCRLEAGLGGNTQVELASTRHREGWYRKGTGRTQSGVLAKTAGRSITRMVQPRELRPDRYYWESPVGGQTR